MCIRDRPSTAFRGGIGGSTECPSGGVHMRLPLPTQRFVTPQRAPPRAPAAVSTCVSPTQHS
eukprot:5821345-Pyramimonas_sp.AAC.1